MRMQAVIFDLDGLMVDSEPVAEWAWCQVLSRYGHALDDGTLRDILGMRVQDSARFITHRFRLPDDPKVVLAAREGLFLGAIPDRLRACPGLEELLDELAGRDLRLAVASSAHLQYLALALSTLGLEERFAAVVSGDEVAWGKPAADVYLLAAEGLGVPPLCCLALEDAPLGAESALAAGMACAVVPNLQVDAADFPDACRVLPSLEAVRGALDDLLEGGRCASLGRDLTWYAAAGGVVVRDGCVLLLERASRGEVRLPKGHVKPGEEVRAAALREVAEESGHRCVLAGADLGAQLVEYEHEGQRFARTERYFLMAPANETGDPSAGEDEFEPLWLPWDEALARLSYEPEREWVRRGRSAVVRPGTAPGEIREHALEEICGLIAHMCGIRDDRRPFIVGIGGPAGVGKSTMAARLERSLIARGKTVLVLGLDSFFKSPQEREGLGEWGPDHVRLDEVRRVLDSIRRGRKVIRTRRYVRSPRRRMISWTIEPAGADVIVLEGLYAIGSSRPVGNLSEFVDLAIYVGASLESIKLWRFQQEEQKPEGRDRRAMKDHWEKGILPDVVNHVQPTEVNADIVVRVGPDRQTTIVGATSDLEIVLSQLDSLGGNWRE
jgi:HAD superfamily hydrolase (TIGR01509 family)